MTFNFYGNERPSIKRTITLTRPDGESRTIDQNNVQPDDITWFRHGINQQPNTYNIDSTKYTQFTDDQIRNLLETGSSFVGFTLITKNISGGDITIDNRKFTSPETVFISEGDSTISHNRIQNLEDDDDTQEFTKPGEKITGNFNKIDVFGENSVLQDVQAEQISIRANGCILQNVTANFLRVRADNCTLTNITADKVFIKGNNNKGTVNTKSFEIKGNGNQVNNN